LTSHTPAALFAALALLATPFALAHPTVNVVDAPATPVTQANTLYWFQDADNGAEQVWIETNQKLDHGVYSYRTDPAAATGLQMHNVCYGTFAQADVAAYNADHYGLAFLSYVPWTGTADACAAAGGQFVPHDTLVGGYDGGLVGNLPDPNDLLP
jgi:hypothetical protein